MNESRLSSPLNNVFIQPDLRRKRLNVEVLAPSEAAIHVQVEGTPYSVVAPTSPIQLDFPEFTPWTPESPVLYQLRLTLTAGAPASQTLLVPFGMRELTVKDDAFHLNHRPLQLRGILYRPQLPEAEDAGRHLREAISVAKGAGFNQLVVPAHALNGDLLLLAAEDGILITASIEWNNPANGIESIGPIVRALRPYTALVMWQLHCAAGCAPPAGEVLASLDPARVWMLFGGGKSRQGGAVLRPYHTDVQPCDAYAAPQRMPVSALGEYFYRQNGANRGLLYLDGLCCPSLPNAQVADVSFRQGFLDHQLDRVFAGAEGFAANTRELQSDALRFQFDALRANVRLSGYCLASLCDIAHDGSGIVDASLQPKLALASIKRVHGPLRPLIYMQRKNLTPREEVSVVVLLANEQRLEGRADLSLQVVGPTNQVLWKKKRAVKIPRDRRELWEGAIAASGSLGAHRFVVRLLVSGKVVAENSLEFLVIEAAAATDVRINVIDLRDEWGDKCRKLAAVDPAHAQVCLLPPLGNSIRAYPEKELAQMLGDVRGGAVAVVFGPPEDWNDLARHVDPALHVTSRDALGLCEGAFHYVKLHPVFEGLPARGLMRQPYRNVAPAKAFVEASDEDFCGVFVNGETPWWGSDAVVRRYGSGRIVFTHLRILENLGFDPLADRLFVNLINHFARRSVPSDTPMPPEHRAIEWLRGERMHRVRRWMIAGDFPNWRASGGQDTVYPPEQSIAFDAEYIGWYRIVRWRPWFSVAGEPQTIDLHAALRQDHPDRAPGVPATAYAYAEFSTDRRQEALLCIESQNEIKCWLNGALLTGISGAIPENAEASAPALLKQGKNSVLVKCSTAGGDFGFQFRLESQGKEPLSLNWWK